MFRTLRARHARSRVARRDARNAMMALPRARVIRTRKMPAAALT